MRHSACGRTRRRRGRGDWQGSAQPCGRSHIEDLEESPPRRGEHPVQNEFALCICGVYSRLQCWEEKWSHPRCRVWSARAARVPEAAERADEASCQDLGFRPTILGQLVVRTPDISSCPSAPGHVSHVVGVPTPSLRQIPLYISSTVLSSFSGCRSILCTSIDLCAVKVVSGPFPRCVTLLPGC